MGDEGVLAARLKKAGYRLTRQRLAVVRAMTESPTTFSAVEVWQKAKAGCPDLGLATVYRTLDILHSVGGAERLHGSPGGGFVSCPAGDHHHVVCVVCGRVAEFRHCHLASLIPQVSRETGFRVEWHSLELAGTCPTCLAKERAK